MRYISISDVQPNDGIDNIENLDSREVYFAKRIGQNDQYIFNTYLKPLFYNLKLNIPDIHIIFYVRSDDIFQTHDAHYTQPPLYFYQQVMLKENSHAPLMVSQNLLNPVAKYMYENNLVIWKEQTFKDDLELLLNCEILVFGYSTLIYVILLLSKKLKHLYLPRYAYECYINQDKFNLVDFLNNKQLTIIDLPGYPGIGEFKYTYEHLELMIQYDVKNI